MHPSYFWPLVIWFEVANCFQALDLGEVRRGGGGTEYQRGSKLAEMWFWSQKFSMCRAVGLRLFIIPQDWDGGSSYGTSALIWRRTAEKRTTYGCTDPSTRSGIDWRLKIVISPRGNESTRSVLLLRFWFSVNCTCGWHFIYWKRLHGIILSTQTHLYSLRVQSLDKNKSRKSVVCIIRACSTHHECFFIYFYTSSPPHSAYAWFLTRLLLHKNAIQWISYHWMVWFGSQSVSSPCPWEACSVLLPAVYLWAGLGPALLIIHETSTDRKRSQHHAGSLSQATVGVKKNIQFSVRLQNENRWKEWERNP